MPMGLKADETICDLCSDTMPMDESNTVESGEHAGATVCNECYAGLVLKGEIPQ